MKAGKASFLYITLLLISILSFQSSGQETDSLRVEKRHSPKKASLLSAALPGLGQAYNRKYLKIPVIYAALGTTGFFIRQNNKYYKEFKTAYQYRTDGDPNTTDKYTNYSPANLQQLKDYYRRNLELSILIGAGIYLLNIIDASVDAHLFGFDVSENLSMHLSPVITPIYTDGSLEASLSIRFIRK